MWCWLLVGIFAVWPTWLVMGFTNQAVGCIIRLRSVLNYSKCTTGTDIHTYTVVRWENTHSQFRSTLPPHLLIYPTRPLYNLCTSVMSAVRRMDGPTVRKLFGIELKNISLHAAAYKILAPCRLHDCWSYLCCTCYNNTIQFCRDSYLSVQILVYIICVN